MKYMITVFEDLEVFFYTVTTTAENKNFLNFPAKIGNPSYDAFLEESQLTDKQVHALKPDVWYDFSNGDK